MQSFPYTGPLRVFPLKNDDIFFSIFAHLDEETLPLLNAGNFESPLRHVVLFTATLMRRRKNTRELSKIIVVRLNWRKGRDKKSPSNLKFSLKGSILSIFPLLAISNGLLYFLVVKFFFCSCRPQETLINYYWTTILCKLKIDEILRSHVWKMFLISCDGSVKSVADSR